MAYAYCRDPSISFSSICKQSGFNFALYRGRVDWKQIGDLDVDRLIRERDLEMLYTHLSNITNCHLETEYDVKILDPNFIKLFRLSQLSIDFLLHCKQYLEKCVNETEQKLQIASKEIETLRQECNEKKTDLKYLKKKIKEKVDFNIRSVPVATASSTTYFKCSVCGKIFVEEIYLQGHYARRHPNHVYSTPKSSNVNLETTAMLQLEIKQLKERLNVAESQLNKRFFTEKSVDDSTSSKLENGEVQVESSHFREDIQSLRNLLYSEIKKLKENGNRDNRNSIADEARKKPSNLSNPPVSNASTNTDTVDQQNNLVGLLEQLVRTSGIHGRSVSCSDINLENTLRNALNKEVSHSVPLNKITTVLTKEEVIKKTSDDTNKQRVDEEVKSVEKGDSPSKFKKSKNKRSDIPEADERIHLKPPQPKPRSKLTIGVSGDESDSSMEKSGIKSKENGSKTDIALEVNSVSSIEEALLLETSVHRAKVKEPLHQKKALISQKSVWNDEIYDTGDRRNDNVKVEQEKTNKNVGDNREGANNNTALETPVIVITDCNKGQSHSSSSEYDIPIHKNIEPFTSNNKTQTAVSSDETETTTAEDKTDLDKNDDDGKVKDSTPPKSLIVTGNNTKTVGTVKDNDGKDVIDLFRGQKQISVSKSAGGNRNVLQRFDRFFSADIVGSRNAKSDSLTVFPDENDEESSEDEDDDEEEAEEEEEEENVHSDYVESILSSSGGSNRMDTRKRLLENNSPAEGYHKNVSDSESSSSDSGDSQQPKRNYESRTVASNIQALLNTNPEILRALRTDLEGLLDKRLRELGIDPEWTGLPKKTFQDKMTLLKHHQSITAKRYKTYFELQRQIEEALEQHYSLKYNVKKEDKPVSTVFTKHTSNIWEDNLNDGSKTPSPLMMIKRSPGLITSTPRSVDMDQHSRAEINRNRMTISEESESESCETTSVEENKEAEPVKKIIAPVPRINVSAMKNTQAGNTLSSGKKQKRVIFLDEALASGGSTPRLIGVQSVKVASAPITGSTKIETATELVGQKKDAIEEANNITTNVNRLPLITSGDHKTESDSSGRISITSIQSDTRLKRPGTSGSSTALSGSKSSSLASLLEIAPHSAKGEPRDRLTRTDKKPSAKELDSSDWDIMDIEDNMRI